MFCSTPPKNSIFRKIEKFCKKSMPKSKFIGPDGNSEACKKHTLNRFRVPEKMHFCMTIKKRTKKNNLQIMIFLTISKKHCFSLAGPAKMSFPSLLIFCWKCWFFPKITFLRPHSFLYKSLKFISRHSISETFAQQNQGSSIPGWQAKKTQKTAAVKVAQRNRMFCKIIAFALLFAKASNSSALPVFSQRWQF